MGGCEEDEDNSLWSEDEDLLGNKKKWKSMKSEKGAGLNRR